MQLSNSTLLQVWEYRIIKTITMLVVLTLSATSIYAQAPIKKPEKKNATTTTPQKPRTNTSTGSQSSSSTATKPATGTINGHEWVDLGLSVKWATCNVGASSPSDYGNYYAWGETSTKSSYTEENSKTYGKSMVNIASNSQYDVAHANWGSTWRLPTADEIDELVDKCTWTWNTQGGHNGYKIMGPNGNSIFLPAAGIRLETSLDDAGEDGLYWSATSLWDGTNSAYSIYFTDDFHFRYWNFDRFDGATVRPVSE